MTLAVLAGCLVIGLVWFDLSNELRQLRETPADNLQWNITQLELDVARLETALVEAISAPDASLEEVRKRFDLFYSRARTVGSGTMLDRQGLRDAATPMVARMSDFLEHNVARIDGSDTELRRALPDIREEASILRLDLRAAAIRVIDAHAALQDTRRTRLSSAIHQTAITAVGMILMLMLLLLRVLQQTREARHREDDVRRMSMRLEATVLTSLDAVVVTDSHGRVIEFNPAAERMFGYDRDEALGQPMSDLIIPERHIAGHEAGMRRMREGGERRVVGKGRIDMTARDRSGREFPVELSIASAEGPEGAIFIGFLRDITEARAAESALISARDTAQAAEQTKTNFIAVMSHEMRTPLNGMMAALDIIGQGRLDDRQSRFLDIARDSSLQLLRHVNDVLEISRIEAGQAPTLLETVDLAALLATLVEPMVPQAAARGTTLDLRLPAPLPPVMGDPFRLGQILQNLLSNAVKFTEGGLIVIEAEAEAQEQPDNRILLQLCVRDTGIGIAPADHDRIFRDFEMVDPSFSRKVGGTGLGLAISRRLARAMGGEISVQSELGQGSAFTLSLSMPLAPEAESRASVPVATAALERPLSVLVVEDNPTNRIVLEEMLRSLGHSVELAVDGAEGVSKARTHAFDLVLMDLSMPRVDGWTATALIRADGASMNSRILAVTAHASTRADPRFATSGFDGLLTKPLTTQDLAAVLLDAGPLNESSGLGAEDLPLLDEVRLAELRRMGETARARLFDQARSDLGRCIAGIGTATPTSPGLLATLHEAAGVAAVIGARRLHALLQAAEAEAGSGDAGRIARACAPLADTWQKTEVELCSSGR
ncbi:hybrid sensor histidine kinase/response regulator [Neotabrizicola shimadae]|uniref:histidine kinase n=1 Tax=Neotabrizicola shimadae TaxID=2807096 RepID=A0A8G0ZUN9_9RHOB|nr:ATP-binding protein [Neotabrizicola shimadae]QYZ69231.1 PAS domain S-box protein [Neotabrizicola shimadae]